MLMNTQTYKNFIMENILTLEHKLFYFLEKKYKKLKKKELAKEIKRYIWLKIKLSVS